MQYCLSAKLTATAKSLSLARVYCNFVVVPHEITVRESLRIQSYKQKILLSEPRKNFSLQRDMLIATHPLPPHFVRHLRYTKTHFSCNEKCWSCYTRRVQGAGKKVSRTPKQVIYRGTTLSHRLRRCQLPFREHIKVRLTCKSQRLTSTVYLP